MGFLYLSLFLSFCGLVISSIYGAWLRVLDIGQHCRFGSGVGLRVPSVSAITSGTCILVFDIDLHR